MLQKNEKRRKGIDMFLVGIGGHGGVLTLFPWWGMLIGANSAPLFCSCIVMNSIVCTGASIAEMCELKDSIVAPSMSLQPLSMYSAVCICCVWRVRECVTVEVISEREMECVYACVCTEGTGSQQHHEVHIV